MSALARRVELSPLTAHGMVARITLDLDDRRSVNALCVAISYLGFVADGLMGPAEVLEVLRGLALTAQPYVSERSEPNA